MLITNDGVVISERDTGENDRIIEILSAEYGIVEISVKGARKITGKNNSSTQLFAYSDFCYNERGGRYYLNSSEPIHIFYNIRLDMKKLALACYFAELVKYTTTAQQSAKDISRLMLNTLHFLSEGTRSCEFLKSVFEFRLMSEIGLLPQLIGCRECYCYESDEMYYIVNKAMLLCGNHFSGEENYYNIRLTPSLLHTMRFICLAEMERLFNFKISDKTQSKLNEITEKYILTHLSARFKTLEFYKTLL